VADVKRLVRVLLDALVYLSLERVVLGFTSLFVYQSFFPVYVYRVFLVCY